MILSIVVSLLTSGLVLFLFIDFVQMYIVAKVETEVVKRLNDPYYKGKKFSAISKKQEIEEPKIDPVSFSEEELYLREKGDNGSKRPVF